MTTDQTSEHAPASTRMSLDVNVDQTEKGKVTLTSRLLGTQPYVVVQIAVDETGALAVQAEVAGPKTDVGQIGWVLKMLGAAMEKKGNALTAQAMESGEIAVATMKGSDL